MDPSKVLSKALGDWIDALIPTDEFISEGTQLVEKIVKVLKAKSKFAIDRHLYAGSLGKHTEIMSPDFDITVFVNTDGPPFESVLEDFDDILKMADDNLKIDTDSMKISEISLQFKLLGSGVEVDLVPAANFVKHSLGLGGGRLAEAQRKEVMKRMKPSNARLYSGSLSEAQLEFVRKRSAFIHSVVRIGKFWFKTLYIGGKPIYGIKSMLELIAISAGEKEEDRDEKSLLRAFMNFLDDVSKLDHLKLAFKSMPTSAGPRWAAIPQHEMKEGLADPSEANGFPRGTLNQHNFIMEPANPFNNLAQNLKNRDRELDNLKIFAKCTMERLRFALAHPGVSIYEIFRPLPTALVPKIFNEVPKLEQSGILSGTGNERILNPTMIVRNENIYKYRGMGNQLRAIQGFLYTAIHIAAATLKQRGETVTIEAVKKSVERMIDEDIKGTPHTQWIAATSVTHEDYDVTFSIPLSSNPDFGVFKTSFRWEKI